MEAPSGGSFYLVLTVEILTCFSDIGNRNRKKNVGIGMPRNLCSELSHGTAPPFLRAAALHSKCSMQIYNSTSFCSFLQVLAFRYAFNAFSNIRVETFPRHDVESFIVSGSGLSAEAVVAGRRCAVAHRDEFRRILRYGHIYRPKIAVICILFSGECSYCLPWEVYGTLSLSKRNDVGSFSLKRFQNK